MAIQVGRADAVVLSSQTVGTNIDVSLVDYQGNAFTPVDGEFYLELHWSGRSQATDTVGGATINFGQGMGAVIGGSPVRRCFCIMELDAQATSNITIHRRNDAVMIRNNPASATVTEGRLDLVGGIANGIRFVVDEQFGGNVRFSVFCVAGLTGIGIADIVEPGGTGTSSHTGFGVTGVSGDLAIIFSGGSNTAYPEAVAGNGRISYGAGHSSGSFVAGVVHRNAQTTMDNYHNANDTECLLTMNVVGAPISRGRFNGFVSDGISIIWDEVSTTGALHPCAILRGVDAKVFSNLTQTDTTTAIAVTGLTNPCRGGVVVSCCSAEDAVNAVGGAHATMSFGNFVSTSSRSCHATFSEDATADSETSNAIEYDSVYANISTSDVIQGLMDVQSLDSNGATFIMDDADPVQGAVFGWLVGVASGAAAHAGGLTNRGLVASKLRGLAR